MNFSNITTRLVGHSILLVSPTDQFVYINGIGDFQVCGAKTADCPGFILDTFSVTIEANNTVATCKIYDVDDGPKRYLAFSPSSTRIIGAPANLASPESFSIFSLDANHCLIYSNSKMKFLSMDFDHNLDPDRFACNVYANKTEADISCVFEYYVI